MKLKEGQFGLYTRDPDIGPPIVWEWDGTGLVACQELADYLVGCEHTSPMTAAELMEAIDDWVDA